MGATAKWKNKRKNENRRRMAEYLIGKKCMDCYYSNPIALEFDHVRGEKKNNISRIIQKGSWEAIVFEISKCDLVCSNCHRIRTSVRNQDYKARAVGMVPGGQLPLFA